MVGADQRLHIRQLEECCRNGQELDLVVEVVDPVRRACRIGLVGFVEVGYVVVESCHYDPTAPPLAVVHMARLACRQARRLPDLHYESRRQKLQGLQIAPSVAQQAFARYSKQQCEQHLQLQGLLASARLKVEGKSLKRLGESPKPLGFPESLRQTCR